MTNSEKEFWERMRAKGIVHYFIFDGILRRGILSSAITTSFTYEVGSTFGRYSMPVGLVVLIFLIATLVFGIGWGALLWHLQESEYQKSIIDDHVSTLRSITKTELSDLGRKIGKRQRRRMLLVLPVLVIMFGGLSIVPNSSPYRDYYVWSIIIVSGTWLIMSLTNMARGMKADCYEFGAICPRCSKPLFSSSRDAKGRCPNCGYQLFDDKAV